MKKLMIGIMIALCAMTVTAATLSGYEYYVSDKVSGRNLELVEFDDELGIIDTLMYNDMMKTSSNIFKGEFAMGYPVDEEEETYFFAKKVSFSGKSTFDGGSYIKYKLTNFTLDDTNMNEFGMTEVFGKGVLVFEEKVIVKRAIPVRVDFMFDSGEDWHEQKISMESLSGEEEDRLHVIFQHDEEYGKNKFRQKRKCVGFCEEE